MSSESTGAGHPWPVHRWHGSAAEFHGLDLPFERSLWLCEPAGPALVLGSTQPDDAIDLGRARSLGLDVARRRSGGGVVFVDPAATIWIDLTIPRGDPLWVEDVSSSMLWLGTAFVAALRGWVPAEVYDGAYREGEHGRTVCFAGLAPGEVVGPAAGSNRGPHKIAGTPPKIAGPSKIVGISQRRGRNGARFQCLLHREWTPGAWAGALSDSGAAAAAGQLEVGCVPVGAEEVLESLRGVLGGVGGP